MKLTLREAVQGYMALQRIGSEKMPIKQAYTLQRNMRIMESDVKAYEEKRIEFIKSYNAKNETGEFYVPENRITSFQKKMAQLGETEIEAAIQTIPMEDVSFEIAPNDLISLAWLFVDGDTPRPSRKRHK